MSGVNKAIIIGNLGKDPEITRLENSVAVARFSVATGESWKDKNTGEKKERTEWHNVVLWRGLAEVAEKYLKKGASVYVEGKMRTRSWEKDGVTKYITELHGDIMKMLGSRQDNQVPPPTAADAPQASTDTPSKTQNQYQADLPPATQMDDLPF